MAADAVGQFGTAYQSQFQLVRAIELLLGWENAPNISAREIVYAAHQAGADINHLVA